MASSLENIPLTIKEGYIPTTNARLYYREIGQGLPLIILHGGPDFDHNYFLPHLDRLADSFRLIYYAQRGRGMSSSDVRPEDVTLESEIADLDAVRAYFALDTAAVLGHSWGGLLAMEYATRYPGHVNRLILMNAAPASRDDFELLRQAQRDNTPEDQSMKQAIAATQAYQAGDIATEAVYYRHHFRMTVRHPEHLERVINSLRVNFTAESILKARAIEQRLYNETWLSNEYSLLPRLRRLDVPTLIIHGDADLIPVECAAHIAEAICASRFTLLEDTGHFSFIEHADAVGAAITSFFH